MAFSEKYFYVRGLNNGVLLPHYRKKPKCMPVLKTFTAYTVTLGNMVIRRPRASFICE